MRHRLQFAGLGGAAIVAALAVFATAASASQSTKPPWEQWSADTVSYPKNLVVDDDGVECPNAPYTDIQDAVNDDAAAPPPLRKNIQVCPGTYSHVDVPVGLDDLKITSTTHWGATITPSIPCGTPPCSSANDVVDIHANNVKLLNFTISGPGPSGCGSIQAGVFVRSGATGVLIKNNHVTHIRDEPFSGCQNGIGVIVGRASVGETGSATVTGNVIDDYQKGGVVVSNTGSSGVVTGNKITGAGPTDVIAQNGIQVSSGATGTVKSNTVYGNIYTPQNVVSTGILLFAPGDGVTIQQNSLVNGGLPSNDVGVYAYGSNGVSILGNKATFSSFDGIDLDTVDGGTVSGNLTQQNEELGVGLFATTNSSISTNTANRNGTVSKPGAGFFADSGSSGNTFSGNSAKTNYQYDCQDDSTGGGTSGTANTWTGNTGSTSSPAGLCSPPIIGAAKTDVPRFAPRTIAPLQG